MILVCIDPDTICAGLAIFGANPKDRTLKILKTKAIRAPKDLPWPSRVTAIANEIWGILDNYIPTLAIVEMPMVYQSAKGQAAANSGSLEKLLFATGVIFGKLQCSVELVNPPRWKGNVPKEVTAMRVLRHWGWKSTNNDETDAVGIGDWYFRKCHAEVYRDYRIVKVTQC